MNPVVVTVGVRQIFGEWSLTPHIRHASPGHRRGRPCGVPSPRTQALMARHGRPQGSPLRGCRPPGVLAHHRFVAHPVTVGRLIDHERGDAMACGSIPEPTVRGSTHEHT